MKSLDYKKVIRRGITCIGLVLLSLCLFVSDAHAYKDGGDNGYHAVDWRDGECYTNIYIRGGPNGEVTRGKVYFYRPSSWATFNYTQMQNASYSFKLRLEIVGTNHHNLKLKTTQLSTKLDNVNAYNIVCFDMSYDMPAHYVYSSWSADKPNGVRTNFNVYSKMDDNNTNTAQQSGSHNASKTTRNFTVQANTATVGVRTYKRHWYTDCSATIYLAKPTRTVTQYHYYRNEVNNTWNHFNTTTSSVGDANYFAPYNVSAPTGYYAGNNYSYYNTAGASLGSGTVGQNSFHVCGQNYTVHVHYYPYHYYLDLNGMLDGVSSGGISGFGTADVYVNGTLVANDVSDYYTQHPYGSTYQITDIRTSTGRTYNGVYSGSLSGTINGNKSVVLSFSTNNYTNYVGHWAGGFTKGEGNNGGKNMYNLANTTFTAKYGSTYSLNSSKQTTIPKGFYLGSTFGSPSINGSWRSYNIGTNVTQKAGSMSYEYYYYPYNYNINYNLNGGTNSSNNPSTYNILYGVTLSNPTRAGYQFLGWYNGNTKMTGINQGSNATFSSASDMYNKLNSRTIGNVTLTAKWNAPPTIQCPDLTNADDNAFIDKGKVIIQLGDSFNPSLYAKANDIEDGNLTSKLKIESNVPVVNGKTTVSGTYTVKYTVTDSNNASASYTLTVIVNQPPTLTKGDRTFFLNQYQVTPQELLKKIIANDKEDGNITPQIQLLSIQYADRVENNPTYLDTSKVGDFKMTYKVTDSYRKTVTETSDIHVVENDSALLNMKKETYRFISDDYLNTIDSASKWKTDTYLNNKLKNSVSQENPSKVYRFNTEDMKNIKNYINQDSYKKTSETNSIFASLFLNR